MELRHLRYFVAVAEELHFGRAARRLHIVQPALSQQIQKLERELGVVLLNRSKRRVSLTEPGRAFLEEARRALSDAEGAMAAARWAAAGKTGRLRVGYVDLAIFLVFPDILRRYRERYPDVQLDTVELSRREQREALDRGGLDVGFYAHREGEGDFSTERVAEDPMIAVLPEDHPVARRDRIPLEALAKEPWVLFPTHFRSRYLELVLEACAAAGFTPRVEQEAGQMNTLAVLVGAGLGVTLLPSSVARLSRANIAVRPLIDPTPVLPQDIIWRRDDLSPAASNFVAIAREVRDERG
ncbi:MAG: LysR substrate-binding domain-containing protein [Gemmatimonadota bacterium]|jgi:DNA-binding transcriptional LysR family regulator